MATIDEANAAAARLEAATTALEALVAGAQPPVDLQPLTDGLNSAAATAEAAVAAATPAA